MYLVAIAWIYVVLMMALAEALSPQGSVLGAVITFVLYGMLPLSIVMYVMGTPMRRRARLAAEAAADAAAAEGAAATDDAPRPAPPREEAASTPAASGSATAPDSRGHAARDAVAPVREER
jgi:hypothetical protein